MNKLNKKFSFINDKGEREELKITPEGSMWILAYGYDTIAEWKRVRREAQLKNKKDQAEKEATDGKTEEKKD
ncbi:MAG: hypothetical protein A2W93_14785 [Bacteroidetes bacterium GWF2_43_63]|nr:MAG: hypothetical protein A2W94_01355 [Bacteroidetes bacterium GWE2_42_42]OFY52604.1 MAG: hypothetical protein A2W93_14785 [Bacteroidetes bacterium GWF2_43_63]HBG69876.1 hypothetical protein [Bacteroidales bacterium]HCB62697.1 hypothetical protein [Bacteroidales bacterium]HCY23541.1 hypothetical protein [Bacteroidales bacterium]